MQIINQKNKPHYAKIETSQDQNQPSQDTHTSKIQQARIRTHETIKDISTAQQRKTTLGRRKQDKQ